MSRRFLAITAMVLVAAALAAAQVEQPARTQRTRTAADMQAPGAVASVPPIERSSITRGSARIGGQTVNYTATAATYVLRADDGEPKAVVFFAGYTKDGVTDISKRPVSFVYNGGPGSASCWTHMGLGPRRPVLEDDGTGKPAPYALVENESSFLDVTDLVFIDAISTGYSRPVIGENPAQFYGQFPDATWFSDFIYQYLNRNGRWTSPKFLIGESYGTTRSAILSSTLQSRHKIHLNGIILVSAVAFGDWGADDRSIYFLPTYTTSGWYHKVLPSDLQSLTIDAVAQKAREFAHGPYAAALEKGDEISESEYRQIVKDIARFTGLSTEYIERTNLRINPQRWFKELLRNRRLTVGRLDSRFTGMDRDAAGERYEYDSSQAAYEGPYVAMFHDYVRRDLKWDSELYYTISARVQPWDRGQGGEPAEALRSAMTQQRHLKVLVVSGYYDLATPFNGIEHTVSHMSLEPSIRKNVSFTYYEAGHMMYIDTIAREKLHKDVTAFIKASY